MGDCGLGVSVTEQGLIMSVVDTIKRARALDAGQTLLKGRSVLSTNAVTGYSVNFPIYGTCKPSKLCIETCYAGAKSLPINWNSALNKQVSLMNSVKADPYGVGEQIVREVTRKRKSGLKFLRWNGVGDLFEESVICLGYVAERLPDVPIWVVTRIPKWAAVVPNLPNIFVQFSLDAPSLDRYERVMELSPLSEQLFFSYTEGEFEENPPLALYDIPISVYYTHLYKKASPESFGEVSCELNDQEEIKGGCERCGRCWSSDALILRDRSARSC